MLKLWRCRKSVWRCRKNHSWCLYGLRLKYGPRPALASHNWPFIPTPHGFKLHLVRIEMTKLFLVRFIN